MEGGYVEMKKEYMTPEAEMVKFVQSEEIMNASIGPEIGVWDGELPGDWN